MRPYSYFVIIYRRRRVDIVNAVKYFEITRMCNVNKRCQGCAASRRDRWPLLQPIRRFTHYAGKLPIKGKGERERHISWL